MGTLNTSAAMRVLLVEDDVDSRETLGELITSYGHQILATGSPAEALELARSTRPDLAFIDLSLPEVSGCELARRLRSLNKETCELATRLVALTGYSDREMRESASAAGFDDYIVKPIKPAALQALLRA